jgi:hypothetical protein
MRDNDPTSEVVFWCDIMNAWLAYQETFLSDETLSDKVERKLLGALLEIFTGIEDFVKIKVPLEFGTKLL